MELREMKYFLAVAREENISKAAQYLFITQPSLTRQIQNMEKEIGQPLFVRTGRKMVLTETGALLRKRAEEIMSLYEKTEAELLRPDEAVSGDVYIGGGETYAMKLIADVAQSVRSDYPDVRFHLYSADSYDVSERLDNGIIDFGVLVEPEDLGKYDYIRLPFTDTWGVLMRKDSPLAGKDAIAPEDLVGLPVLCSKRVTYPGSAVRLWYGTASELNIVATYNLIYNASLMVKSGMGYAVGLDMLVNTSGDSDLCFRPFTPKVETSLVIAWKKYQIFSKPARIFLERLRGAL